MKERIVTGVIAAILFLIPLVIGGYWFIGLALLMAALCYRELATMIGLKKWGTRWFMGLISLVALFLPFILDINLSMSIDIHIQYKILIIVMMALLSATIFADGFSIEKAGALLIGILYIGFGFFAMADARIENGAIWTFSILVTIWATDSGAYFVGKKIGRRKLAERVSPNKTIEGTVGGVVIAILVGVVLQAVAAPYLNYTFAIMISLLVSVAGQLGDLIESGVKRHYGVKDSSNLLPGHGGLLDRTDSWVFVFIWLQFLGLI